MRDIERRMGRLEGAATAGPETIAVWIIDGGVATHATTGETTSWGELSARPVAAHEHRIGVLIVEPDLEDEP
jgi:hypothetical protein